MNVDQIGEEFIDQFSSYDSSLWIQEDGRITCIEQHCSYMSKKNLQYSSISNNVPKGTFLEMTMKNDCNGKHCCIPKRGCTKYIGSQISSKILYHYGSFRFLAKIHLLGKMSEKIKTGRLCFSLEGKGYAEKSLLIAICIAVRGKFWAQLYFDYEGQLWAKPVRLDFDASIDAAVYRIDFQKDYVTFWIKGVLVGAVKSSERNIPNEAVFMNVNLLPEAEVNLRAGYQLTSAVYEKDPEKPGLKEKAVELRAHVYRVRYVTWDGEHQDLFVFGKPITLRFEFILLIIATFLSLIIFIFFMSKKNFPTQENMLNAILLESQSDNLSTAKRENHGMMKNTQFSI